MVVEGGKYRKDILSLARGTAEKPKGGFRVSGGHGIKKQELEELDQGHPGVVIVGTGTNGAAQIAAEGESRARADNTRLLVH